MCYFWTLTLPRVVGFGCTTWIVLVVIAQERIIHPAQTPRRDYLTALAGILAAAVWRLIGIIRQLTTSLQTRKDRASEHRKTLCLFS